MKFKQFMHTTFGLLGVVSALSGSEAWAIQRAFINPGFEEPALTCQNANLGADLVPGWSVVASVAPRQPPICGVSPAQPVTYAPIEIWRPMRAAVPPFLGIYPAEGQQVAELNAFDASRLYQEMCILNGETINYRFQHHARPTTNTPPYVGYPSPDVLGFGLNDLGSPLKTVQRTLDGTLVDPITNPESTASVAWAEGWKVSQGAVVFLGTSGVYEVGFHAVSSGSGSPGAGNVLDDVMFSVRPMLELKPGQNITVAEGGNAVITLRISGVVPSGTSAQLSISGGTAAAGADYRLPNGTTALFTVPIPEGNYGDSGEYSFSIPILADAVTDGGETFTVGLVDDPAYLVNSTVVCGGVGNRDAVVTIQDSSADMTASVSLPAALAPGSTVSGTITCTNAGPAAAYAPSCAPSVVDNLGNPIAISNLICLPSPVPDPLGVNAAISCTFDFTAPGSSGGTDTAANSVTVNATTGATNDINTSNNQALAAAPIVDAVDLAVSLPPGPATTALGSLSQYPSGSVFSVTGSTCAGGATVNATTGVASYTVPPSGTCTVSFQICAPGTPPGPCDTATLTAPVAPANVTASVSAPATAAPGSSVSSTITCTNAGPGTAYAATCTASATNSTGVAVPVTLGVCTPTTPATLASGASITCVVNYPMPGTAGGSNTPETAVTVTASTGASNDSNPNDNSAQGTTGVIDAVDLTANPPPGLATTQLGTLSQYPTGSTFSLVSTTCAEPPTVVVSSDGAATYTVPNTGQCTVTFKICAPAPNGLQCDTATLTAPVTPANVTASVSVPATAAPGSTQSGSITCTNAGPGTAFSATCAPSITDSTGAVVPVAGLTCSPSTPADLGLGVAINCRFSYTMPGTAGGSDTAPTGVTVVATAGAKNDTTTSDNTATGTTALVDAVDVKVDQPAGSLGHINLKTLSGVTAPAGSTFGPNPSNPGTCGSIRIDPATGMASLIVPTEGSCTVTYQICPPAPNASQCDAATVTVNAWTPVSVPTLGEWARAALGLLLAVFGAAMSLRPHRA